MDKKRLDHNGPRRSTYGENGAEKEAALDKLRQMEWKRNKIESWHLARPPTPPIEMKKTIKNEDYFGGTGIVKNKKGRKPRPEPGPPLAPAVPPGFAISAGSSACGPPPVNAWSQKKGSSLFNKGMPEDEEEDEILLLVKKESMKTLEEDRKRQQERMLMMNKQVSPSTITTFADEPEAEWETQEHGSDPDVSSPTNSYSDQSSPIERNMNKSSSTINYSVPPPAFVDSDSAEEYPVKQTRKPERQRKSASPPTLPDQRNADRIQEKKHSKVPMKSNYSDTDRFSPRGIVTVAPNVGNIDRSYDPEMFPIKDQETGFSQRLAPNRGMMIPEREDTGSKISGLADSIKSTLTFGDTQGLLESFQRGQSKSVPPIIDDVDLFLHNVIRHDPPVVSHDPGSPSQAEPDGIFQLDDTPKVLASVVANIESEAQKEINGGNPLEFAKMNGQASSPQFSESSSSQSPFGSLGKQSYNYEQSPQTSPPVNQAPFPYGLTGNQDISNLVNQNLMAQMSAYMQRFAAPYPGVFPVQTINPVTGLAQFMPPMMMPTIPGQDMSNPLYQQLMLNNYYAQLALMQNQTQPVSTDAPSQTTPQTSEHQQTPQNFQNHQVQQNQQIPQLNNHIPQNYQNQQQILPMSGITQTLQNYAMNQNQPIPQMPENTPALQTHPMNQNQQMPENTPALQNYPMNQNQQMPENTPALQNYPINQNQQMPENTPALQNYPINQNQQMPENTQALQNYPMNQNQRMPENTQTLQNYPMNQNQQMPENTQALQNYPMSQNQQMPENTLQNYPMNQNQQMPKNTMPLQNYPMNQNQQMPESTPTLQNYPMNQNQQMPENTPTLQNFPMVQNQQIPQHPLMPQNIPNLHNYPMNQNQQIPQNTQIPQNPLTQIPLYQAMLSQAHSQMIPSANPEHIVPENQDTCHPNQFPINSYQQSGQNNLNSVPQADSAKNQDKIQALNQTLLQTLSQLQEMGGQLPVQMPIQVPVPGFYPRMVQYPQMDQSMGHVESSRHTSPASSSPVYDGYDSSESREQAPPLAHNPSQFYQLPNVAPRGRGQGRRP